MLILIGQENGQSKFRALTNDFKAVNEFFLLTEIWLKSFNKSSFQNGEKLNNWKICKNENRLIDLENTGQF